MQNGQNCSISAGPARREWLACLAESRAKECKVPAKTEAILNRTSRVIALLPSPIKVLNCPSYCLFIYQGGKRGFNEAAQVSRSALRTRAPSVFRSTSSSARPWNEAKEGLQEQTAAWPPSGRGRKFVTCDVTLLSESIHLYLPYHNSFLFFLYLVFFFFFTSL